MSTKFYINNDIEIYRPPAWQGGWTNAFPFSLCNLDNESWGSATSYPYFQIGNATPPPHKSFLWTGVSRVLQPQTISGTVDAAFPSSAYAANNAHTRMHIWVVNATTGAVFATLLDKFEDNAAPKWPIWPTSGTLLSAPQTLTPCTIPNDGNIYRLVVEFGAAAIPTAGSIYNVQVSAGSRGRASNELLPDTTIDTVGLESASTITFSHNFLLAPLTTLPANKTIDTAIDLGPLPVISTYNSIGPYYHWFKINSPGDVTISAKACNTTSRYILIDVYSGDLSDNDYQIGTYYKYPISFPAKAGKSVFFRIQTYQSPVGDPVSFDIEQAPGPAQIGDLLVLSDNTGTNFYDPTIPGSSQATWFNTTTGKPSFVSQKIAASELGISLANGRLAIADQRNDRILIYEKAPILTEIRRFSMPPDPMWPTNTTYAEALGTDFVSIYVGTHDDVGTPIIFKISETGVVGPKIWHLASTYYGRVAGGGDPSIGITRDGRILYYGDGVGGGYCRRHDLVTDTEILPLFPRPLTTSGAASYTSGEVIVMPDNSIVCLFVGAITPPRHKLVHYSPAGVILREVPYYDDGVIDDMTLHHICHNSTYDMKVWIFHNTDGNRFQLLNLETGVIEKDFENFYVDEPPIPGTCTSSVPNRYDCSSSCPLMVMMQPFNPMADISGIYSISPNKSLRHDSYNNDVELKIPDPVFRIAPLGE